MTNLPKAAQEAVERLKDFARHKAETQIEAASAVDIIPMLATLLAEALDSRDGFACDLDHAETQLVEDRAKLEAVGAAHMHYEPDGDGCSVCAILGGSE